MRPVAGQLVPPTRTFTEPSDVPPLRREPLHAVIDRPLPADTTLEPTVRIEKHVGVGSGSHIGPENYRVSGCRVKENAVVR